MSCVSYPLVPLLICGDRNGKNVMRFERRIIFRRDRYIGNPKPARILSCWNRGAHPDHETHNIPRKLVSYVQYGLPAPVNRGTDLEKMIKKERVGKVYSGSSVTELKRLAEELGDNDALR